eukprot:scaffold12757_cov67-Cyclotella_meneghiniana.AAC.2
MERHFFERGKGNVLQKLPWTASDEQNLEAPVVTLRLQNQKNGWESAYMSQHDNGLGYNSLLRGSHSRVTHRLVT